MGWGRLLLLGDIGQQLDIQEAAGDIASLKAALQSKAALDRSQDERLAHLQKRVLDLELCVASLLRLLAQKQTLSAEELSRLAHLVDAREDAASAGDDPWDSDAAAVLLADPKKETHRQTRDPSSG
jgi:hypothetical protein